MPASVRHGWFVVGLLWIAFLINYADRQVVFSIFPVLRRELYFSNAQLALTGTVFTWVYSVSMPVMGRIADLVRRDRIVILSVVLWSLATLGTSLSGSVAAFVGTRALMGISEALFMPAALAIIATLHTGGTRSRALSIFATGQFAGIAAGGWYGGWAADHTGWRTGLYSLSALGLLYALVLLIALRARKPQTPQTHPRQVRPSDVLRSRTWLALALAFFTFCAMLWVLLAWLASFVHERYGLSLTQSGLRATVFLQAGSAVGTIAGGFLGDRAARRIPGGRFWVGACGLLGSTPFAWAAFTANSLGVVETCAAGFGLLGGLFMANLYAGAYDVVSERNYGFAAGALNLVGGFAGGAAVLLTGVLKQPVGISFAIRGAAIAAAASALVLAAVAAKRYPADRAIAALPARG